MKNYNYFIKKCLKKKYKDITIFDKNFLRQFFLQRNNCLKLIKKKNIKKDTIINNDKSYFFLNKIYKNKIHNQYENEIIVFYKKFEVNLHLKKSYNKKYKKKSNNETSIGTYLILGLLIMKIKKLNKLQKINSVLKILDKILFNQSNILRCNGFNLSKLIKYEIKLIKNL